MVEDLPNSLVAFLLLDMINLLHGNICRIFFACFVFLTQGIFNFRKVTTTKSRRKYISLKSLFFLSCMVLCTYFSFSWHDDFSRNIFTPGGGGTRSENDHTFGPKNVFQNRTLTVQKPTKAHPYSALLQWKRTKFVKMQKYHKKWHSGVENPESLQIFPHEGKIHFIWKFS